MLSEEEKEVIGKNICLDILNSIDKIFLNYSEKKEINPEFFIELQYLRAGTYRELGILLKDEENFKKSFYELEQIVKKGSTYKEKHYDLLAEISINLYEQTNDFLQKEHFLELSVNNYEKMLSRERVESPTIVESYVYAIKEYVNLFGHFTPSGKRLIQRAKNTINVFVNKNPSFTFALEAKEELNNLSFNQEDYSDDDFEDDF